MKEQNIKHAPISLKDLLGDWSSYKVATIYFIVLDPPMKTAMTEFN